MAKQSYALLFMGCNTDEERVDRWAPILKWWEERQCGLPDGGSSLKSVGTRIRQCKEQLASIVSWNQIPLLALNPLLVG